MKEGLKRTGYGPRRIINFLSNEDTSWLATGFFIGKNLPGFAETLSILVKNINGMLEAETDVMLNEVKLNKTPSAESFVPFLRELEAALQSQNTGDIDRILEELMRQPLDENKKAALEQISDEVLMAEYEKAGEILGGLVDIS